MRKKRPQHGDVRVVRRFAILPIFTPDEWRWLVWVNVEQMYSTYWDNEHNGDCWYNIKFID